MTKIDIVVRVLKVTIDKLHSGQYITKKETDNLIAELDAIGETKQEDRRCITCSKFIIADLPEKDCPTYVDETLSCWTPKADKPRNCLTCQHGDINGHDCVSSGRGDICSRFDRWEPIDKPEAKGLQDRINKAIDILQGKD